MYKTKHVELTTENGTSWNTELNGTVSQVEQYFLGMEFNVGVYPNVKLERVNKIKFLDK